MIVHRFHKQSLLVHKLAEKSSVLQHMFQLEKIAEVNKNMFVFSQWFSLKLLISKKCI